MLDAVGFKVIHLIRTGFGKLRLGGLKIGHYRYLDPQEVLELKKWREWDNFNLQLQIKCDS